MTVLLTGSTGYIGRRLLPVLLEAGHRIVCLVRDKRRFDYEDFTPQQLQQIHVLEADLTKKETLNALPDKLDVAFYLVHSMSASSEFQELEQLSATNFVDYINKTTARQVIYLSGIINDSDLSEHLKSRKNVELILQSSRVPLTVLRSGIIIGSGSASFEIIRDLVEKLPVMIAPRWLKSRCQPIAIRNVIEYMMGVMGNDATANRSFDIGGPDVLTYGEMLMGYARVRKLKRLIITVPVLSPKLSSLWLYFITSTSFTLAKNLVTSLKNEVVCKDDTIRKIVPLRLIGYEEAIRLALDRIQQKLVISSWKDSIAYDSLPSHFLNYIEVPTYGCFTDKRVVNFTKPRQEVIENIWRIGGDNGWYYGNMLWLIRGFIDRLFGGVGLRRGRRSPVDLKAGDALDFWRVLLADKQAGRLLLYAEMKLPGEAWLEFKVTEDKLIQTATFRPLGLWGRLYWYLVLPFHHLIFPGMARNIALA
ncbi:MAG: SDR family oxidoreductase [Cyclobacteriaceae bacterium]|nr:SDR family oxidoreductase [Cyclobacteriaceae bacterium]